MTSVKKCCEIEIRTAWPFWNEGNAGTMAKKILVMDDDPTIADLLTEALADEGYETFMTTQSLRFYDSIQEHKPDLVLLDLMMPYLDGRDELKLMTMGIDKQIPVIVVTAFLGAANEEQEFREAGVVHIVYKPFDLDKLVALVKQTIGEPEEKSA
ncbi:sporulation initiation phosphotransferase F [Ktedonobacter sp. SOSP1-85]|uniref:Sporulation initiation phosphotransferase F n=2 Tax=Ktedonobacteraceae TaxID=388449 RepID=A0ABQ3UJU2_9CHLR|nr:sporulation initiation phosphotransferase F [Ktedonobacter robiniae]GHO75433.1 sporulation initiation phosphotransferase F [Ktedonobacter sp. SOSP1-85]